MTDSSIDYEQQRVWPGIVSLPPPGMRSLCLGDDAEEVEGRMARAVRRVREAVRGAATVVMVATVVTEARVAIREAAREADGNGEA